MEKKKSSGFDRTVTVILVLICLLLVGATVYKMYSPEEEVERAAQVTNEDDVINVSATAAEKDTFIQTNCCL